jgi:hypothetical protein
MWVGIESKLVTRLRDTDVPGVRTPVWGIFFTLVQTDPRTHPASCTMGSGSLYRGSRSRDTTLANHPRLVPTIGTGRPLPLLRLCTTCGILQGDLYPLLNFRTQKNILIYHGFLQFLQKTVYKIMLRTVPSIHIYNPIYCSSPSRQTLHFPSISQPSGVDNK